MSLVIGVLGFAPFLDIITSSATIGLFCLTAEPKAVNIEIHDAALEARIQKQLQSTSSGIEELLVHLLEKNNRIDGF